MGLAKKVFEQLLWLSCLSKVILLEVTL